VPEHSFFVAAQGNGTAIESLARYTVASLAPRSKANHKKWPA
jgi:hypothetical protein